MNTGTSASRRPEAATQNDPIVDARVARPVPNPALAGAGRTFRRGWTWERRSGSGRPSLLERPSGGPSGPGTGAR